MSREPRRTVTKAVIPAAGLGTRFLPATKAIPKEMIPIVDRPAIQYMVEECARAEVHDVLIVTGMGKAAVEDHFDRRLDLEQALADKGKTDLRDEARDLAGLAQIHSVRQGVPLGLGHAVLMARSHVGEDSFAVLLGDDIVDPDDAFLERMIAVHERSGRPVVAVMEVPEDQVHLYGVVTATETDEPGVYAVTDLVEKPDRDEAPSNLAVIGRYVLPGEIFDVLAETKPGRGDEIQLTDALKTMADDEPILAVRFDGVRHDVGDKMGFLKATVMMALEREDLGPDFRSWLTEYVESL